MYPHRVSATSTFRVLRRFTQTLLLLVLLAGGINRLVAQTTGSIEGVVRDPEGAVIPKASVTAIDRNSKVKRATVSNGEGGFYIAALPASSYDVVVTMPGFDTFRVTALDLHPGDHLKVSNIAMKVGAEVTVVTVTATAAGVNLTSGEKSSVITADDIQRLSTVGRDATELIKFLPGFAVSTGGSLNNVSTSNNAINMGFGNSSVSSFSANGATPQTGASVVVSDGASTMDPGDAGASIQNVNMDMVQEIKVQTASFGADSAKGPVVISAVSKAGGDAFHGSAYLIARNGVLNANDWYSNNQGASRPPTSYYYPGFNIGGPVVIPGTSFNRSRKLHFFTGFEYYKQQLFSGLLQAFVPTPRMLSGDLTPPAIAAALNISVADLQKTCPNFYTTNGAGASAPTLNGSGGICYSPGASGTTYTQQDQVISNGVVTTGNGLLTVDPRSQIYAKFWPAINRTPHAVTNANLLSDGYNYQNSQTNSSNGFQYQATVDQDISTSTKLKVIYKLERVNYEEPVKNEYYAGANPIPYPTPEYSQTRSHGLSLNLTKTFGPNATNEFVAAGVYYNQPANFGDPSLVDDSKTGWAGGRYYNNGAHQLPGIIDYELGVPSFAMAYDPPNGGKFLRKFSYNVQDSFTRQIRQHTFKAGVFFETQGNNQVPYNFTQGQYAFNHYNSGCVTNDGLHTSQLLNSVANFLQGCGAFTQTSSSVSDNLRYRSLDFFLTDEWKLTSRLTLTLGMRFEHLGAWYSPSGIGLAVWNAPTQHVIKKPANGVQLTPAEYPGVSWHQTDSSVPLSGQPTRPMFYSPRFALAYDLYGDGKTTFRGGIGYYRFHDSYNDSDGALATVRGIQTYNTPSNVSCTYDQVAGAQSGINVAGQGCLANSGSALNQPFSITALNPRDDRQPLTYNYTFTVDQVMPHGGFVEISYVGNQSADTFTAGNLRNQNYIPLGGLFQPDPITNVISQPGNSQQVLADYRPYPNYVAVNVPNHIGYGNYNGLQASYQKQKGALIYRFNYTWSKALGVRGDYRTGVVGDPSNLRNNYGLLGFNRSHAVNATFSWQVGRRFRTNRALGLVFSDWEFSGINSLQSGPDIAVLTGGGNLGLSAALAYTPPGATSSVAVTTGSSAFLGTPDITIQPVVTCDPKSNLHSDPKLGQQYVNGNCFALPAYGTNGTYNLPDIHGPAYFDTDLTVRRSVRLAEKKSMQFSIAGFNFINHPLPAFIGQGIGVNLSYGLNGYVANSPQDAFAHAVQQNANFGYTANKQGYRIVELSARYNF